ncbi:hypothetical protein D3P07_00305 [Paenibacillus sp. 1011MAR3C5]|uniref:EamA family transporter n=1 Tax=Paenibacillus sp. 1011MAR3C5 TaxID=1675787 RepID=UPI000E6D295A|nr:EamA family transporter [Paenibacillus sp. 1011MAR3C5]RJE90588.1 hypothetical protein D3P07_00305 [Paenibacillus sp. 1011MAR3C5]
MVLFMPFAAASLFLLQSLLLKRLGGRGQDTLTVHAAYMLLVAAGCLIAWASFSSSLRISPSSVGTGMLYGIDFALTMILYAKALTCGPLSYSSFCFSASMLIPVAASSMLWGEKLSLPQVIGIVLFLLSFYFILVVDAGRKGESARPEKRWYGYALGAFVLNGLLSVFGKLQQIVVGGETAAFLGIGFLSAAAVALLAALVLSGRRRRPDRAKGSASLGSILQQAPSSGFPWLVILALAATTGIGNGLVVWLTPKLAGAYLFPTINGSVIVGLLFASRVVYGERLTAAGWTGALIGVAAVILVSL